MAELFKSISLAQVPLFMDEWVSIGVQRRVLSAKLKLQQYLLLPIGMTPNIPSPNRWYESCSSGKYDSF